MNIATTRALTLAVSLLAMLLSACSSRSPVRAPVDDRSQPRAAGTALPAPAAPVTPAASAQPPSTGGSAVAGKTLRGQDNLGKPGHYTVQRGDTLVRIALDHGQNWRDLARWNNLDNPNLIEVGEVLRVLPPTDAQVPRPNSGASASASASGPASAAATPSRAPLPAASAGGALPAPAPMPAPAPVSPVSPAVSATADDLLWVWPAQGPSVAAFDEVKNKGIDIAGKAGDAVLAAADGRVVYAGSGLRGYGNLIIIKHNNTYLTAYAHNQSLLVKEDQAVKQGQKIAEMGSTDTDRVKLHFEIRRQGKPVDPLRFLPPR